MNVLVKITIIFLISLFAFQVEAQNSFTVTVTVEEANSNDGKMFIALYNSNTGFLKTAFKSSKSDIKDNQSIAVFEDIPEGVYAVSVLHDENDNGKMDTNFIGIPKEDYGCSNGATGFMGPPKWDDAKFELKENKILKITL